MPELPIPVLLEFRESWDEDGKHSTAIHFRGNIVGMENEDLLIKTVPFRPKNAPHFYRMLILRPVHAQDAEKGLVDMIIRGKTVQCDAIYEISGNKVNEGDLGFRGTALTTWTKMSVKVTIDD